MNNILIVEDSKSIANTLSILIEEELNYNAVIATTMKEAASSLLKYKGKIQVALLDLGLPDSQNGEIVDFINKFNIPTIILTGSNITEQEKKIRDKDIVDYVIKDGLYSLKYAVSVVKRIINNAKSKVLLVDDSRTFLESSKDLIEKYMLTTFVATNGEDALTILKKNPEIKIVITDYNMPKMDGLELTREIRKEYSKDELSIIVSTSIEDKTIASKFLKYGANDFIYKGFSQEELFARLSANLEIIELFEDVKNRANRDFLTNMYNRRYLFDIGVKKYEKAKLEKNDFAVAIIDIDKFKNINDTYGHDIGDIAIKEVAKILDKHFITTNDLIARLGGEEFCILINDKKKNEVESILENVRQSFENNIIKVDEFDLKYTVSIGCSFEFGKSLDEMIQSADQGLYIAKDSGRNQVRYR